MASKSFNDQTQLGINLLNAITFVCYDFTQSNVSVMQMYNIQKDCHTHINTHRLITK